MKLMRYYRVGGCDVIPSVRSKWETESWKALILMKVSMETTLSVH